MAFRRFTRKPRFRRFRRKGNQGVWFPILGSNWTDESGTYNDSSFHLTTLSVPLSKAAGPVDATTAVTRDYSAPNKPSSLDITELPTLRDFTESQDYILKRIVGNCVVFIQSNQSTAEPYTPATFWSHVKVTAGFFVARAIEDDQTVPDLTPDEFDPSNTVNTQNPWIWRRSWILANPANIETVALNVNAADLLTTNRDMEMSIGPFVDTKSRRRIRREERLWFTAFAIGWDGVRGEVAGGAGNQPNALLDLDIRIFGKMVKGKNASNF